MLLCIKSEVMALDIKIVAILIGVASGAFGYWFTTFSMQPILRYRELRSQVLEDLIYYAQVVNAEGLNEEMKNLHLKRVLANRSAAAKLFAVSIQLPTWFRLYLKIRKQSPNEAASSLIGLSNTYDYDDATNLQEFIRMKLGLPNET